MATVYRLVKKKWLDLAFTGEGAKCYGGRWNNKGKPCIYVASSESLAILEIFVHLENQKMLKHYALFELNLPEQDICYLDLQQLPQYWQDEPAPPETASIGDKWLDSDSSLALAVPSVIVPREWNYLLNPNHVNFHKISKHAKQLSFEPDMRLIKT